MGEIDFTKRLEGCAWIIANQEEIGPKTRESIAEALREAAKRLRAERATPSTEEEAVARAIAPLIAKRKWGAAYEGYESSALDEATEYARAALTTILKT